MSILKEVIFQAHYAYHVRCELEKMSAIVKVLVYAGVGYKTQKQFEYAKLNFLKGLDYISKEADPVLCDNMKKILQRPHVFMVRYPLPTILAPLYSILKEKLRG
ncbi:MAG: hypothetical protein GY757_09925 [bacterium]|nr:hypothetical protein [bacterium]